MSPHMLNAIKNEFERKTKLEPYTVTLYMASGDRWTSVAWHAVSSTGLLQITQPSTPERTTFVDCTAIEAVELEL